LLELVLLPDCLLEGEYDASFSMLEIFFHEQAITTAKQYINRVLQNTICLPAVIELPNAILSF
jgi:hypothetical protein